ncbi:MAG: Transposase IS200-family protein [Candidatus Gottesmanbacteria bacterium GW2011_GWB1_49_7]|uniref:Transposase IS200-family protein n=1 Tax=Candidatus Gottesmanbacteria bacterium GW2011_GWB1_49_7 TaxID=1618448 RepID=A0A0G1W1W2_9BACT|nr:MAG: Transposase IS200-family protein [Candidatus Gottesmanbacteria bacterium GW2011_GWB1_49_7]
MAYDFDKNSHSVYTLNYHLVQCVKYRRKILDFPEIIDELKSRTQNISGSYGIEILAIETDLDHVHILFKAKPQTDLLKFINNWKSATAKALRNRFDKQIKDKLWNNKFWSGSYCLITTGQTTLEQVKKYVESQGEP